MRDAPKPPRLRCSEVLLFLGVAGFGMVGCCKPQPVLSDAQVITITRNCEANGMNTHVAFQRGSWETDDPQGIVAAYCEPPRKK